MNYVWRSLRRFIKRKQNRKTDRKPPWSRESRRRLPNTCRSISKEGLCQLGEILLRGKDRKDRHRVTRSNSSITEHPLQHEDPISRWASCQIEVNRGRSVPALSLRRGRRRVGCEGRPRTMNLCLVTEGRRKERVSGESIQDLNAHGRWSLSEIYLRR